VAKRRTKGDKRELSLFAQYMHRRADKPTEDPAVAYAEVFGDVVYEDSDLLLAALLSGCCDYKDGESHIVSEKDGCTVYQVACDHSFTKCGNMVSTTARACHLVGKVMVCTDSSNTTVSPIPSGACCH
jgi:hypothetical protein